MKYITGMLHEKERIYPIITAHSGCEGTPDNSIEHIKTALASGAECLEIDVHEHGGALYLTHDAQGNYEGCPTLAQCMELVSAHGTMLLQCDCKEFGLAKACMELAETYGIARRVLCAGSVNDADVAQLDEGECDWWLGMWRSSQEAEELDENCRKLRDMGDRYRMVNVDHRMVNAEMLAKIRVYGYHLSVWTVNNEADLRRYMEMPEIRNITTRKPALALKIRREHYGI